MTDDDKKTEEKKPETVFPGRVMNAVLKDMIDSAPEGNHGALSLQILLRNGLGMNGAVRKHPKFEDVYMMDALVTDQRGVPRGKTLVYFHGYDILRIDEGIEESDLALPAGMGGITGLGRRPG